MKGDLTINGIDAYTQWGITFDSSALSALMTPPGMKDNVKSTSRLSVGTKVDTSNPKLAARSLSLTFNLEAPTEALFLSRYNSFCSQLYTGFLKIKTRYQACYYNLEYNSCSQFSEYSRGMAKFVLKCTENDPSDRGSY